MVTGQLSSFHIKTCCPAPTPQAARGLLRAKPTKTRVPRRPKPSLASLPSEGPHAVRARQESNPYLPISNPARYLYATEAGHFPCIRSMECHPDRYGFATATVRKSAGILVADLVASIPTGVLLANTLKGLWGTLCGVDQ